MREVFVGRGRWGLSGWGVVIVAAMATMVVYRVLLVGRSPFGWDEAAHAVRGTLIAYDWQQGDWLGFLYDTYRQIVWPPLNSWLLGLFFTLFGVSETTAGLASLVAYGLTPVLLYGCSRQMAGQLWSEDDGVRHELVGWMAALLFLTTPVVIRFAPQVMLELPGVLALVAALYYYFWVMGAEIEGERRPWRYGLLAVMIGVVYFTRIQYGVLLALAIAVTRLWAVAFVPEKLWSRENLALGITLGVILGIWFAYPAKLTATWGWLVNETRINDDSSWAGRWLFYPRALFTLSHAPWFFLVHLAAFLWSWRLWSWRPMRLLLTFLTISLGLALFHRNQQARYLLLMLPAFYLVTAYQLGEVWVWLGGQAWGFWGRGVLSLMLVTVLVGGFWGGLGVPVGERNGTMGVMEEVVVVGQRYEAPLVLSMVGLQPLHPPLLDWELIKAGVVAPPRAGAGAQLDEEWALMARLEGMKGMDVVAEPVVRTLNRYQRGGGATLYLGLPQRASYANPSGFPMFWERLYDEERFDGVIVVTKVTPFTPYLLTTLEPTLAGSGLVRVEAIVVEAENEGYQIEVYER
ncbi:MAG TPA: glycosyltransferase family 39 protein [Anaerolineae bacterium]|nr:glycosyltransferase family 39 protein [Anaerolineae bacterium]